MKSIRLLHVTDFHFGAEPSKYRNSTDPKDKTLPPNLVSKLNTKWTYEFFECVINWQRINNHTKFDSIVSTGDLGEKALSKNTEVGIEFLVTLCSNLHLTPDNLILCPGNHDLQRTKKNTEFDNYEKLLKSNGIRNYSCYDKIFKTEIKEIPIISINSCLGGTSKSEYSNKYKKIINKIPAKDRKGIVKEFEKLGQQYLNDFLDIPAIGKDQLRDMLEFIGNHESDSAIILMHHNPVPTNSIEIRPYSNLVDSGKILTSLLSTSKKSFILHGHTHFDYDILSYFPNGNGNYVSSIGCGALNDSPHSRANIYEFYYTKSNKHIITKVHRVTRSGGAGFTTNHSHSIFEKGFEKDEAKIWSSIINLKKSIVFKDLLKNLNEVDEDSLLMFILKQESIYLYINKNENDNFLEWIISKKNF